MEKSSKKELISLKGSVNSQAKEYINDITTLINKEIGINKVLSILLFGSQREESNKNNDRTAISDCDLLIIFKDNVSNTSIKEMEKYLLTLESKYNFRDDNEKLLNKILNVIDSTTGMFVSHFLTKKMYWENLIFHKIFRVNYLFSKLLAPKKIVLCSVIANSSVIYGEDLRRIIKKVKISPFDLIKSLLMNLMISLFSIPLSLFNTLNAVKYQLEAIKWSLRASNFYIFEESQSLSIITNLFTLFENSFRLKRHAKLFFNRFLSLRKLPYPDLGFILRCPFRLLKIHIKGILYRNWLKRENYVLKEVKN